MALAEGCHQQADEELATLTTLKRKHTGNAGEPQTLTGGQPAAFVIVNARSTVSPCACRQSQLCKPKPLALLDLDMTHAYMLSLTELDYTDLVY